MFTQLITIARNTFVEAIRQPIFAVLLLVGTLLMVLNPSMAAYSMEPGSGDNKMLLDLGLGTVFIVGVFLAVFTATGVVSQELQSKTALTVVSKPVPRPIFVVGKYIGVSGAIVLATYLLMLVFMFTLRHKVLQNASDHLDWPVVLFSVGAVLLAVTLAAAANYLYKKAFASTFTYALLVTLTCAFAMVTMIDKEWGFQSPTTDFVADDHRMAQVVVGGVLIGQGLLILTAVAVALSTRFNQIVTILACIVVVSLGMMTGAMSQSVNQAVGIESSVPVIESIRTVMDSGELPGVRKAVFVASKAFYVVLPNFQFHWPVDAILQQNSLTQDADGAFSLGYIRNVTLYSLLYIVGVLGLAVTLFQKREVS